MIYLSIHESLVVSIKPLLTNIGFFINNREIVETSISSNLCCPSSDKGKVFSLVYISKPATLHSVIVKGACFISLTKIFSIKSHFPSGDIRLKK